MIQALACVISFVFDHGAYRPVVRGQISALADRLPALLKYQDIGLIGFIPERRFFFDVPSCGLPVNKPTSDQKANSAIPAVTADRLWGRPINHMVDVG